MSTNAERVKQEDAKLLAMLEGRKAKPKLGLGDIVAAVAHPVAKIIDAVAGTDLENCKPCQKRREALNQFGEKIGL